MKNIAGEIGDTRVVLEFLSEIMGCGKVITDPRPKVIGEQKVYCNKNSEGHWENVWVRKVYSPKNMIALVNRIYSVLSREECKWISIQRHAHNGAILYNIEDIINKGDVFMDFYITVFHFYSVLDDTSGYYPIWEFVPGTLDFNNSPFILSLHYGVDKSKQRSS